MTHPLCLKELISLKQFWRIKDLLKDCLFHLDFFLLCDPTAKGVAFSGEILNEMFAMYCRMVLLQVTQTVTNEEGFCTDLEEVMTWCSEVLGSALSRTSASTDNDRSKRRKKHAAQTQEASLNDRTLEIAKVVVDFFGEVMITGVFPLELRNPLSRMVASWMTSPYGPSLIGPVRKLLYQLADSWTEDPGRRHSLSVDTEELFEGFLGMIRRETTVRGDKFCDKVLSDMRPVFGAVLDVSVRVYALAEDPVQPCPPLVATITRSIVSDMEDQLKMNTNRQWPDSIDDLPCYVRGMTHFICKGGVTKKFFVSHLVSIPSKPKSDLDCKSQALKLLAVIYVVLSLVTVKSSVKVEDVQSISKEVKFFLESLSEEHEESLHEIGEILDDGRQMLEDRISLSHS